MSERATLRDFVDWGEQLFTESGLVFGHGTDCALDEASYLAAFALGLPPDFDDMEMGRHLTETEREAVESLLLERANSRKPASYLTGEAWFAGRRYIVEDCVLVPRSPLAELIEERFTPWVNPDSIASILDIGTGSGCIGIACAHAFPDASVELVDISLQALAVAERNIELHAVQTRVTAAQANVFNGAAGGPYDIVVSNPPYVDAVEMASLATEFRHEPALGLAGGVNGLDIVDRILAGAPVHLKPQGILVVEVGNSAPALIERYPQLPFTWLEFEFGGDGVFLLDARDLDDRQSA